MISAQCNCTNNMDKQVTSMFISFILIDLMLYGTAFETDKTKSRACFNERHKWFLESDYYCCPCSLCDYGSDNSYRIVSACLSNSRKKYYCSPLDSNDTTHPTPISSSTPKNQSRFFNTTAATIFTSVSATINSRNDKPVLPFDLLVPILAATTFLLLLILSIYMCRSKRLPSKVKAMVRNWKGSKKTVDDSVETSDETTSSVGSQSENEMYPDEDRYSKEELLPKQPTDESSTKVSESYQEHPNEMKQRGGSRDSVVPEGESLPPSYNNAYSSSNRPNPNYPLQSGHSYPPIGHPHHFDRVQESLPGMGGPSRLLNMHSGPTPLSMHPNFDFPVYPSGHHPVPCYPSYVSSVSNPPIQNYTGAIILSNIDVKGDLTINGAAPSTATASQQPTQTSALDAEQTLSTGIRSNLQPSRFNSRDLSDAPSCSKSAIEDEVGRRDVHPLLNDYEESRRRQGNTMSPQTSTYVQKRMPSNYSQGSLDLDSRLRSRVTTMQDSRYSTQRHLNASETPIKFFETPEHSEALKIPPTCSSRIAASHNDDLQEDTHQGSESSVSWPVQETFTDISSPDIDDADIYRPSASSDASRR